MKPLTYTTFIRRGAMNVNSNLIMRVIMALMMIVVGLPMLAQEESDPDKIHVITEKDCDFELVEDGDIKYIFIHSTRVKGNVYIPSSMFVHVGESYKEYPVYVVQEDVPVATKITFAPGIKEVLICTGFWLESVKFEGKDTKVAFNFCIPDNFPVKVKEVIFPENLTEFGGFKYYKDFNEKRGTNIFENCNTLTNVRLPKKLRKIGPNMFKKCSSLKSFTFTNDVANIGKDILKDCESLNTVVFPEKFTSITDYMFWEIKSLTNVTWPKTLVSIGENAFENTSIASIELPETVTSIGMAAFAKNTALTRFVFPKNIKKVAGYIFSGCTNLSEVVLPEACTEVEKSAFSETNIKELIIPEGVTKFGPFLCYRCKSIEHVILPSTLTDLSLAQDAFEGCTALKYIVSYAETAPKSRRDMCDDEVYANATLCIPQSAQGYWSDGWEKFKHWKRALGIPTMQNPKSSNEAETFTKKFMLTLTNPNDKGKIYYKKEPWGVAESNEVYTEYTEPIKISESCTIWAYVKDGHYASEYTMFSYKYEGTEPPVDNDEVEIPETKDGFETDFDKSLTDPKTGDALKLENVVIDNVYYNLADVGANGYDAKEQCLIINSTMDEKSMYSVPTDASKPTDFTWYNGIVLVVNGKGIISIDYQTMGSTQLAVKVGDGKCQYYTADVKNKVDIPYDVKSPQFVYIYANKSNTSKKALARATANKDCLKLYGFKITNAASTGIESIGEAITTNNAVIYNMQGVRVARPTAPGLYIINGKKVVVK